MVLNLGPKAIHTWCQPTVPPLPPNPPPQVYSLAKERFLWFPNILAHASITFFSLPEKIGSIFSTNKLFTQLNYQVA